MKTRCHCSGHVAPWAQHLAQMRLSELPGVFASLVPEALIHALGHGEDGRLRLYTPLVTFWAFLSQAVNPEASCRETVRRIQAAQVATTGHSDASSDSSAYCQARRRLPEALLSEGVCQESDMTF